MKLCPFICFWEYYENTWDDTAVIPFPFLSLLTTCEKSLSDVFVWLIEVIGMGLLPFDSLWSIDDIFAISLITWGWEKGRVRNFYEICRFLLSLSEKSSFLFSNRVASSYVERFLNIASWTKIYENRCKSGEHGSPLLNQFNLQFLAHFVILWLYHWIFLL